MDVLTRERAKPALPYGGVHRLIDFALSGLVHAELADVWVSLEYQVTSIDDYLSGGRPWSLDRNRGGFRRIVPQTGTGPATESGFAYGNGDLLLRMSADIEGSRRDCCCCCWASAAAAAAWAVCDGGGGVLRCCLNWLTFTTGPLLCGNCSGRGRECVRSNRPHLLQSYIADDRSAGDRGERRRELGGHTTLPGVRLDRLQVEVSVVRQL